MKRAAILPQPQLDDLAPSPRGGGRKPSQARGRARVEALLDVVELMMAESDIEQIGYYDIVSRAKMSPASVYHFLPTKRSIFEALASRYFKDFIDKTGRPVELDAPEKWQSLVETSIEQGVSYYNAHPPAMRLILGAHPFLEIRLADNAANIKISSDFYRKMEDYYVLPHIPNVEIRYLTALSIGDAVCRASYNLNNYITAEFAAEAKRAVVAYYRTFLPEHLERRRSRSVVAASRVDCVGESG